MKKLSKKQQIKNSIRNFFTSSIKRNLIIELKDSFNPCMKKYRVDYEITYNVNGKVYEFELPSYYGSKYYGDIVCKEILLGWGVQFVKNMGYDGEKYIKEEHGNKTILVIPDNLI